MGETFYITKHALTKGIVRADDCKIKTSVGGTEYASRKPAFCTSPEYVFERIGLNAFRTEREANIKVVQMAEAKLRSIDKERAKVVAVLNKAAAFVRENVKS